MWYCCSQYAVAGAPRRPPPMCTASGLISTAGGPAAPARAAGAPAPARPAGRGRAKDPPRRPPPMCTASGLISTAGGLAAADIAADASAVAPVRALASASEPAAAATGRDRRIGLQDAESGTAPPGDAE